MADMNSEGLYYGFRNSLRCGERLQKLRKAKGKTIQEVANDLEVTRNVIYMFESGKRFPSLKLQRAFADYYNVSWSDLFDS